MKPILFNTNMVRAILDGHKSVTRRVVKPPVMNTIVTPPLQTANKSGLWAFYGEDGLRRAPYRTDDILYVREAWAQVGEDVDKIFFENSSGMWDGMYLYKADRIDLSDIGKWHPSIHMPKEAARLFLRVTDVRVERLQDITEEQAQKEGFEGEPCDCKNGEYIFGRYSCTDCMGTGWIEPPQVGFMYTWDSTVKKSDLDRYGWNVNPWVWVIEFQRISKEESFKNA